MEKLTGELSRKSVLYLVVTDSCNLDCSYCTFKPCGKESENNSHLMDPSIAEAGIKKWLWLERMKGEEADKLTFIFYGGEPLLNPVGISSSLKFLRAFEKSGGLKGRIFEKVIITNGTLISKMTKEFLLLLSEERVTVTVSLDSPKYIHDAFRRDRCGIGSFERAWEGLLLLDKFGIEVGLSTTLTPQSLGSAEELISLAKSIGVKTMGVNPVIGRGLSLLDTSLELYAKEAARASLIYFEKAKEAGIREARIASKLEALTVPHSCADCLAAYGHQLAVFPDGAVGVCQAMREFVIGDLSTDLVILSQRMREVAGKWSLRPETSNRECKSCEAFGICGGGCAFGAAMVDGNPLAKDRLLCEYTKEVYKIIST